MGGAAMRWAIVVLFVVVAAAEEAPEQTGRYRRAMADYKRLTDKVHRDTVALNTVQGEQEKVSQDAEAIRSLAQIAERNKDVSDLAHKEPRSYAEAKKVVKVAALDAADEIDKVQSQEDEVEGKLRDDIHEIRSHFDKEEEVLGEGDHVASNNRMRRFLATANAALDHVEEADKRLRREESAEAREDKLDQSLTKTLANFRYAEAHRRHISELGDIKVVADKAHNKHATLEAEINREIANESKKLVSLTGKMPAPDFKTPLKDQLAKHEAKKTKHNTKSTQDDVRNILGNIETETTRLMKREKKNERAVQGIESLLTERGEEENADDLGESQKDDNDEEFPAPLSRPQIPEQDEEEPEEAFGPNGPAKLWANPDDYEWRASGYQTQ